MSQAPNCSPSLEVSDPAAADQSSRAYSRWWGWPHTWCETGESRRRCGRQETLTLGVAEVDLIHRD
jgi:hypothetical protein